MLNLGKRGIVKQNYTYYISVPRIWLENHGIKKRDKVQIFIDNDRNLVIKAILMKNKNIILTREEEKKNEERRPNNFSQ